MPVKKGQVCVLLGTDKGAFILQSDARRKQWKIKGPFLKGSRVFHLAFDERDGKTIYAAVNSGHFGPTVCVSEDFGRSWKNAEKPPRFPEGSALEVENVWHVEPGSANEPDVVYSGVAKAGLFRSEDKGNTWNPVDGLNNHATRPQWAPGAGGMCLHSIVLDPSDPKRMYVGISAAGVFKTEDGGQTWMARNKGVRADFLPVKFPEVGQCVHKLRMDPKKPEHLYQQNHCGVYRSENGGDSWTDISNGLPPAKDEWSQAGFGFPLAVHPQKSGTIYVVPEAADAYRVNAREEFNVYGSSNGGRTWKKLNKGLPRGHAYLGCFREGFATDKLDPAGLYVGTRMGHVFYSANEGRSWQVLAQWLPPVFSVSTGTIS